MKIFTLSKITSILSLVVLGLLLSNQTMAQEYTITNLTGPDIAPTGLNNFVDLVCGDQDCDDYTVCAYHTYLELGIDPLSDPLVTYAEGDYELVVNASLSYYPYQSTQPILETPELRIKFNKDGGRNVNKDRFFISGGFDIVWSITSVTLITPNGASLPVPAEAYFEVGYITERFEPLANTAFPVDHPDTGFDFFINLNWPEITGAESYDLEWTWIDDEVIDADVDQFIFKNNATRVNTENNGYIISNIYRKGILFARVRGRGRLDDCETYVYTDWSIPDNQTINFSELPFTIPNLSLVGHREGFNWQHSRSYAEEGKHKDVITYFDGTMRSRQTVSKLESEGHAVIAENYYDHVGRATVQALPAPFIQGTNYVQNIDYYEDYNTAENGIPYNRAHFEIEGNNCNIMALPMDESGSGQYYSDANTITEGHQAYVPDAEGFPFSQTIFTQDQTGRVRAQGGVGGTHQLGDGHETRYYYGIPEQQELDRLFGNNAGYAQYYEKNLVVDANGQVSVSYLDNKNRTVATALAGEHPTTLLELPSYEEIPIISDLSPFNRLTDEGTPDVSLNINKQFTVSTQGNYNYDYKLVPQNFTDDLCAPSVCFDCAYELKLVVYDECGNPILENTAEQGSIQPSSIDNDCEDNANHEFTLVGPLDVGSYSLNKVLSLDREVMKTYEDQYVLAYECATNEIDIFNSILLETDLTGCINEMCLGDCMEDIDVANYNNDLEAYVAAIKTCLDEKISDGTCQNAQLEPLTQCGAFRRALEFDMSPGGQYGTVHNEENEVQRTGLPCTSFYATQNTFGISYDEINYGGIEVIINGISKSPKDLSLNQFVDHFEPEWLEFILPYHPEHVFLKWCGNVNAESETFDANLLRFNAEDAIEQGYLNPLGHDPDIIGYEEIGGAIGGVVPGALQDGITREMLAPELEDIFPTIQGGIFDYSIWDLAYIIALSNVLDIGVILTDDPPLPGEWDERFGAELCRTERFWEAFRGLYMSEKGRFSGAALVFFIISEIALDNIEGHAICILGADNSCIPPINPSEDYTPPPPDEICCECPNGEWETIFRRYNVHEILLDDSDPPQPINSELTGGIDYAGLLNDPDLNINSVNGALSPALDEHCNSTCEGYRAQWKTALAGCVNAEQLSDEELGFLLDEMVLICAEGCDPTHMLGSSSTMNNTMSFQMALETALENKTNPDFTEICNDLLITSPAPYDTDIFAGTQPFIDDCVCDRYNQTYEDYSIGIVDPSFEGFYNYLQNTYQVDYPADNIIDLDCACRQADPEYLLETPTSTFEIPEPFTCVACIDCDQAADLYATFTNSSYGQELFGTIDAETFKDANFQSVLTSWFNQELHFNLSFGEYHDFLRYCVLELYEDESPMMLQAMELPTNNTSPYIIEKGRLVLKPASEQGTAKSIVSNADIDFDMSTAQNTTTPGGTVLYDIAITNTGTTTLNFDYFDELPGGWTFDPNVEGDLFGGNLNTAIPGTMEVTGIELPAGESITWTVTTVVTTQVYLAQNYYHQGKITETSGEETLSDDPATAAEVDPTGIFLKIDDPCLKPVEEAEDFVVFLNEVLEELTTVTILPHTIPVSTLTSFGPGSSLNLWPNLDPMNVNLEVLPPSGVDGTLDLIFVYNCTVQEILCGISLTGISSYSDISVVQNVSPTGITDEYGNYIIELDIINASGIETTITGTSCYSFVPCEKRRLCNRSITIEIELVNNCLDYIFDLIQLQAETEYETIIDKSREEFRLGYSLQCMGNKDMVIQTFNTGEHHYTLYYYDQSGSLIRTIPPNGVHPIGTIDSLNDVAAYRAETSTEFISPNNTYRTNYQMNSYNQVIHQDSPDATEQEFFFDRLGRVVASQDGRQRDVNGSNPDSRHSYTIYDEQSRVIEVGEIIHTPVYPMTAEIASNPQDFQDWLTANGSIRVQVVKSIYDENLEDANSNLNIDDFFDDPRTYLRKRISSSLFFETYESGGLNYDHASHYDYDVHGNVKTLIQEFASLKTINEHLKRIDYDYDLVSGNVHQVSYQAGDADAFYHKYLYDADNRITSVETSHDGWIWDQDATYEYYDHGPLARSELGENKVQGCDYVYTIHGWIKGVNSNTLVESRDIGKDGQVNGIHDVIAADVYGYSLGYYTDDYKAISTPTDHFLATEPTGLASKDLFNGNIRSMVTAIKKADGMLLDNLPSVYTYDQLHRIKGMIKYNAIDEASNTWAANASQAFRTAYSYDQNGNLLNLIRRDANSNTIDNLTYNYHSGRNLLDHVDDPQGTSLGDIDGQAAGNYEYDNTGNLIADASEDIFKIEWNAYGKIKELTRNEGVDLSQKPNVSYQYDAAGNRVLKRIQNGPDPDDWTYTYYVRDANGNVMAVYEGKDNTNANSEQMEDLFEREFHLYGSNRLGIKSSDKPDTDLENYERAINTSQRFAGHRSYELSNHLGNVLVAISDNKLLYDQGSALPLYKPEVISYSDYYPFGWEMPGRTASVEDYRYGFNGKENDREYGDQLIQDYGFRLYNPSIGKFLSVDPLTQSYPMLTPYQFASNTPIQAIDLDGLEAFYVHGTWSEPKTFPKLTKTTVNEIFGNTEGEEFDWSGNNIDSERQKAGRELADHIISNIKPNEPLTLIGHSHGGNVSIIAANILKNEYDIEVDNLLTINTPVREYQLDEDNSTSHFNVYHKYDPVQGGGGNSVVIPDGFLFTGNVFIPVYGLGSAFPAGEMGPAKRKFDGAINIKAEGFVGKFPGNLKNFHDTHTRPELFSEILDLMVNGLDIQLLINEEELISPRDNTENVTPIIKD